MAETSWLTAGSPNGLFPADMVSAFRHSVDLDPDAIALVFELGSLSRKEVWFAAAQHAKALPRPRDPLAANRVLLLAKHGPRAVIGMLAAWLAGFSVVPVDPDQPEQRIQAMIEQAMPQAILVADAPGYLPKSELPRVCVEIQRPGRPDATDAEWPHSDRVGEAYVIFTSGSTGKPKGVPVSHSALAEHCAAWADLLGLTVQDRVLQFASPSFDVAMEEIWPTLGVGASLAFRPDGGPPTPEELLTLCESQQVSVLQLPTAYWRVACRVLEGKPTPPLLPVRTVVVGGEAASLQDARSHFLSAFRNASLVNGYGPTECVITVSAYVVASDNDLPGDGTGLPLGEPVGRRQLLIVPTEADSEEGELWIVSDIMSSGYLGSPILAEGPFTTVDGRRAYITGDIVRRHADGSLEFLRRRDGQVKVRGYRIELGDVEYALRQVPGVMEAAGFLASTEYGGNELHAAVILHPEASMSIPEILAECHQSLPSYAIPTTVSIVRTLPVTPGGKVDRRALADLASAERHAAASPELNTPAAGSEIRDSLQRIMMDLLGGRIGPDDDIFDYGADSLLAMRLVAGARGLGLQLDTGTVLSKRTCSAMAAEIGVLSPPKRRNYPESADSVVPLLPAQARWLNAGELVDPNHFWLAALFSVPAGLRDADLEVMARTLCSRHESLTLVLDRKTDELRRIPDPCKSVVSSVELVSDDPELVQDTCQKIAAGIDFENGPTWRLGRISHGAKTWLFIAVHHFFVDGLSMTNLADDLELIAKRNLEGTAVQETCHETPVSEYSAAVRHWLTTSEAKLDASSWLALKNDYPADLKPSLTVEKKKPTLDSLSTLRRNLNKAITPQLVKDLPHHGIYPKDITLLGITHGLSLWTGNNVQQIDVYAHSRDWGTDMEITAAAGYFQATYPSRITHCEPTIAEMQKTLGAAHVAPPRPFGFDALRFLSPDSDTRTQLMQVPTSRIRLNFRGHLLRLERDSLRIFAEAPEGFGRNRSPRQEERYLLMFEGDITDGRLEISVKYSDVHYSAESIQKLLDRICTYIEEAAMAGKSETND